MKNGILVVNKDINMTSRDVVNKLTSLFGTKRIGHTGTLDPLATGVLVVCINKYTKLVDIITSEYKEYVATIKLGIETDTIDITGNVLKSECPKELETSFIDDTLKLFLGRSIQEVPIFSAIHVNGKRLYEYARNNIKVDLPKREVDIKEIELLEYKNGEIKFRCVVSKGTYIRSLIKDICNKLGVLGTMNSLVRTKQGNFFIENSYTLEDIRSGNYKILDIMDALDIQIVNCDLELLRKVKNGVKLENYSKYRLFIYDNERISLYDKFGKLLILF